LKDKEKMKTEPKISKRDLQLNSMKSWLTDIGMEIYYKNFEDTGYENLDIIMMLNDNDLDAMEITSPGHRRAILNAALKLRAKNPSLKTEIAQSNNQEDWIQNIEENKTEEKINKRVNDKKVENVEKKTEDRNDKKVVKNDKKENDKKVEKNEKKVEKKDKKVENNKGITEDETSDIFGSYTSISDEEEILD